MTDITNNPFPQQQNQSLSTSDQAALIRRSDQVVQANVEKVQSDVKLPFYLHNERVQMEIQKHQLNRLKQQVANVEQSENGDITNMKDLPHMFNKIKRRLKSSQKSYERMLKKMVKKMFSKKRK